MKKFGIVYLYHLNAPLSDRHTARHYIGFCSGDLNARDAAHRARIGSRFLAVAVERGIEFHCVRAWRGTRHDERYLKRWHNAAYFCPICRAAAGKRLLSVARLNEIDPAQYLANKG